MAGRRLTPSARKARSYAWFMRAAHAPCPNDRVAGGADFLRSVLNDLPGPVASDLADEACNYLISLAVRASAAHLEGEMT